jgi:hypothetical protein
VADLDTARTVTGAVELRRVGFRSFPVNEVVHRGSVIATTGHLGWLRIYLGRGAPVVLADGTKWRLRAATIGGMVCPVVADSQRRKIAVGSGADGIYGVNGRDFGYTLNPGHGRRRPDAVWSLRHHETDVAAVRRRPLRMEAWEPVHVGAVLICFVLVRFGIPDDYRASMPRFRWG